MQANLPGRAQIGVVDDFWIWPGETQGPTFGVAPRAFGYRSTGLATRCRARDEIAKAARI